LELVYLWVEDYKNIHKQGFNFSPRFECKYDENTKKLTIEDKRKDYVSIFPDNINVTAIVGENGTGKTTLLELLYHYFKINISKKSALTFDMINKNLSKEFILIFFDGLSYRVINRTKDITIVNDFEDLDLSKLSFFSNSTFGMMEFTPFYENKEFYQNNRFISNVINFIKNENSFYETIYFKPTTIYLKINNINDNKLIEQIANQIKIEYEKAKYTLKDRPEVLKIAIEKAIRYLVEKQYLLDNLFSKTEDKTLFVFKNNENIKDIDTIEYIDFLNKFGLIEIYDNTKSFYSNFGLNIGLNFNQLSTGEQDNIKLFLDIYSYLKINNGISQLIFLDEPNNAQHPNWQKYFIKDLIDFSSNYINKPIYFYITTHSPFILSDIPKESVIFLKKDKQTGNCINVTDKVNINPFGANIHTLLSHGFFMEDGLMGEFAKSKITKIIEILKKEQLSEDEIKSCKHIISIIGEPILQKTLEHQLSGKVNPNETEIQKLEREQKEIQKKIDKLTGKNNEKD
jgi:predicted ATPase